MSQSHYPCSPADGVAIVTISATKLAQWSADGTTALAVAKEQALLFDGNGKLVALGQQASGARYAVWCNVATRGKRDSALATAIRNAVGAKPGAEVRVLPGDAAAVRALATLNDAQSARVAAIAEAVAPMVEAVVKPVAPKVEEKVATPSK